MKRRILFLNENPLPKIFTKGTISGKELRLRAAQKNIDEVHVVSLPGKAVESGNKNVGDLEKKIMVHLTPFWPYYFSPIILFIYGFYYVIKLKPKIIEAESPILSGIAAVILGKLFNIPVLVEVRASYDQLIKMKLKFISFQLKKVVLITLEKFVFKNARVIVTNSKTYQKQIKLMGYSSIVINPGLQYAPGKILKNNSDRKVIGYLGRLVSEKGVDYLLNACKLIETDLISDGWSIEIAGDGVERQKLEKLAMKLFKGSKLAVNFLGFVDNFKTLSKFSIFVNPCLVLHPLEMVNIEAAYMRVPVVCFGNSLIPETVINGKTGLKAKSTSIRDLSEAIKLALKLKFYKEDFDKLILNFSFNTQMEKLKTIYENYGFL